MIVAIVMMQKITYTGIPIAKVKSILDCVKDYPTTYNLNDYNCTDYALNVIKKGGFSLPDNSGTWPGGGGFNPGNLGQDLRDQSNGSNVSVVKTSGTAISNQGNCP